MSAYYNEFNPHAAAWLRNLIKKAQAPMASSASDPRAYGMSDTKPTHAAATLCLILAASPRVAGIPACEPPQEPGFLRMTGKIAEPKDYFCKTSVELRLGQHGASFFPDKSSPCVACENETREHFPRFAFGGIRLSKFSLPTDPDRDQIPPRRRRTALVPRPVCHASLGMHACTSIRSTASTGALPTGLRCNDGISGMCPSSDCTANE